MAHPDPVSSVPSRWDIQRIREQRILQRLQLRMYKRKGIQESEPEVTSFFPEPDDGECLAVPVWGVGAGGGTTPPAHPIPSHPRDARCLSHSGKFADHPLPARRRLRPPLTQINPTVSTRGAAGAFFWDGAGAVGCSLPPLGARCHLGVLRATSARRNFELPWLDERSRCRLEVQKKQTPHRTCRK